MATKYRLKQGVGTHRRAGQDGKLGKRVQPGEIFEPTPLELKYFRNKFELVDTRREQIEAEAEAADTEQPQPVVTKKAKAS